MDLKMKSICDVYVMYQSTLRAYPQFDLLVLA